MDEHWEAERISGCSSPETGENFTCSRTGRSQESNLSEQGRGKQEILDQIRLALKFILEASIPQSVIHGQPASHFQDGVNPET